MVGAVIAIRATTPPRPRPWRSIRPASTRKAPECPQPAHPTIPPFLFRISCRSFPHVFPCTRNVVEPPPMAAVRAFAVPCRHPSRVDFPQSVADRTLSRLVGILTFLHRWNQFRPSRRVTGFRRPAGLPFAWFFGLRTLITRAPDSELAAKAIDRQSK